MNDTTDAAAIFAPLWKRKWLILIVGVLVAVASYLYYKRQPSTYTASTQINLASGAEEQGLVGAQSKVSVSVPKSSVTNATTIITSSLIAEQARKLLHGEKAESGAEHAKAGKDKVRAKASSSGSDIITITAEAHGAKGAARLANAYAVAYIRREHAAYVRVVKTAIFNDHRQLRRIELQAANAKKGKGSSGAGALSGTAAIQAGNLTNKLDQLESELSVARIQQISPAKASSAELTGPLPKKNAIFGFVIGVVLAAIAAFVVDRLDRSLRGLSDVEAVLKAPILAALPSVRSPVVHADGRPAPAGPLLEPMRRVRTTMRLRDSPAQHDGASPRVILCTSPQAGDGKSTLVADLALVKRDAGERIAVIETDFRRPALARLFDVSGESGLADVLAGTRTLWEVIQTVPPAPTALDGGARAHMGGAAAGGDSRGAAAAPAGGATMLQTRTAGSLSVLVGGESPAGAPPTVAGSAFTELIGSLSEDFDCVLIDAPSPLEASDTIPLLSAVDGILLIARVRHTRDVSAERLTELLALPSAAPVLGVVANDVSNRELTRSGFSTSHRQQRRPRLPIRR